MSLTGVNPPGEILPNSEPVLAPFSTDQTASQEAVFDSRLQALSQEYGLPLEKMPYDPDRIRMVHAPTESSLRDLRTLGRGLTDVDPGRALLRPYDVGEGIPVLTLASLWEMRQDLALLHGGRAPRDRSFESRLFLCLASGFPKMNALELPAPVLTWGRYDGTPMLALEFPADGYLEMQARTIREELEWIFATYRDTLPGEASQLLRLARHDNRSGWIKKLHDTTPHLPICRPRVELPEAAKAEIVARLEHLVPDMVSVYPFSFRYEPVNPRCYPNKVPEREVRTLLGGMAVSEQLMRHLEPGILSSESPDDITLQERYDAARSRWPDADVQLHGTWPDEFLHLRFPGNEKSRAMLP